MKKRRFDLIILAILCAALGASGTLNWANSRKIGRLIEEKLETEEQLYVEELARELIERDKSNLEHWSEALERRKTEIPASDLPKDELYNFYRSKKAQTQLSLTKRSRGTKD